MLALQTFPGRFLQTATLAGFAALAACGAKDDGVVQGQPNDPVIVLSEAPCFGTCPVYDMTIHPDGSYTLYGERFVRQTGVREGSLGVEAWEAAEDALESASFWSAQAVQTPSTLQNCHTDAPTARITWRTLEGREKTLTYDAGCGVRKTQDLVVKLREVLHFDDLVWTDKEFPYDPGPPR